MSFYLIEHIEQGTTEWLNWRKGVIGASDAPIIMGENPWRSPSYLLKEKLGNHKEWGGNEATREGSRLEDVARQIIAKEFKQKLSPAVVQDSKDPFLAASLDALSSKNTTIYKIKNGPKSGLEKVMRSNQPAFDRIIQEIKSYKVTNAPVGLFTKSNLIKFS